jgi:hypothetical protein
LPDFIVIGAMKCGTSSLHDQLAAQPQLFMSTPKEPNFFSDDETYARGMPWYRSLFREATDAQLCGESSTHYTKLPDRPHTVERLRAACPRVKLVYVIRNPIDRLISHFIHGWTEREIAGPLATALERHPELIAYGEYGRQLAPYRAAFGDDSILLLTFERLVREPERELDRLGRFLAVDPPLRWNHEMAASNVSAERLRQSPLRDAILEFPPLRTLRRRLVPPAWRARVKALWQMRRRPELAPDQRARLEAHFDADLASLQELAGEALSCARLRELRQAS